jgi:hypothetical protein
LLFTNCVYHASYCKHFSQSSGLIKAGINLANVSVTEDGRVVDAKSLTLFQIGLVGDVPLAENILSLQSGILFTGKCTKTAVGGDPAGDFYSKATTNPYYLEVPVSLIAKLPIGGDSKLFIGRGAYGAIGIAGKNKN